MNTAQLLRELADQIDEQEEKDRRKGLIDYNSFPSLDKSDKVYVVNLMHTENYMSAADIRNHKHWLYDEEIKCEDASSCVLEVIDGLSPDAIVPIHTVHIEFVDAGKASDKGKW